MSVLTLAFYGILWPQKVAFNMTKPSWQRKPLETRFKSQMDALEAHSTEMPSCFVFKVIQIEVQLWQGLRCLCTCRIWSLVFTDNVAKLSCFTEDSRNSFSFVSRARSTFTMEKGNKKVWNNNLLEIPGKDSKLKSATFSSSFDFPVVRTPRSWHNYDNHLCDCIQKRQFWRQQLMNIN